MSFSRRKVRIGRVVSDKMDRTVVVQVEWRRPHRLYKKLIRRRSRLRVHDPENMSMVGDLVQVMESRPLSKTKRWRLVKVLQRGESVGIRPEETDADTRAEQTTDPQPDDGAVDGAEAEQTTELQRDEETDADTGAEQIAELQPGEEAADGDTEGEQTAELQPDEEVADGVEVEQTAELQPDDEAVDSEEAKQTAEFQPDEEAADGDTEGEQTAELQPDEEVADGVEVEQTAELQPDDEAVDSEEAKQTAEFQPDEEAADGDTEGEQTAELQPDEEVADGVEVEQTAELQPDDEAVDSEEAKQTAELQPDEEAADGDTEAEQTAELQPDEEAADGDTEAEQTAEFQPDEEAADTGNTTVSFAQQLYAVQTITPSNAPDSPVLLPVSGPRTLESARRDTIRSGRLGQTESRVVKRVTRTELGPKDKALEDEFRDMVEGDYGKRCQICSKTFVRTGGGWQVNVVHIVPLRLDSRANHFGDLLGLCGWHFALLQYGEWALVDPETDQPFESSDRSEGWEHMLEFISNRLPCTDEVGNPYVGLRVLFSNVYQEWESEPVPIYEVIRYSIPHWNYLCELLIHG